MLKKRIIPIVLIDGYSVLKTIQFRDRRNLGNPITVARTYDSRKVDELILLDIDASKQNRNIDLFTISDISSEVFMPLTVGGGLRNVEDINSALRSGADKVSINTAHISNPNIIKESSDIFGRQCIVASVDFHLIDDKFKIFSNNKGLDLDLIPYCEELANLGAGEILLNCVDLDGMMCGVSEKYLRLINSLASKIKIPLIYAGGVKTPKDCVDIIRAGADAVAASSIFHFTRFIPNDCKMELKSNGIPSRI